MFGPAVLSQASASQNDSWLLFDANSEETDLVRFDWKSIRGTWLEQKAHDAMNYLQMLVTTGSFRSLKAIFFLNFKICRNFLFENIESDLKAL